MSCQISWKKLVETSDLKLSIEIQDLLESLDIFEFELMIYTHSTPGKDAVVRMDPNDSHDREPEDHEYVGTAVDECCKAIPESFIAATHICNVVLLSNALERWLENYLADQQFIEDASEALTAYTEAR